MVKHWALKQPLIFFFNYKLPYYQFPSHWWDCILHHKILDLNATCFKRGNASFISPWQCKICTEGLLLGFTLLLMLCIRASIGEDWEGNENWRRHLVRIAWFNSSSSVGLLEWSIDFLFFFQILKKKNKKYTNGFKGLCKTQK